MHIAKRITRYLTLVLFIFLLSGCISTEPADEAANISQNDTKGDEGENKDKGDDYDADPIAAFQLCKGADISWLTEMEDTGIKFYYGDGREGDCMEILKSLGMNAFRYRVWVNPGTIYNSTDDVITKCKRTVALGLDVMIDFHYSDSWADPGSQTIPVSWQGLDLEGLVTKVGEYTEDVCRKLQAAGITPKWVQVGNETGNGMLYPYGKADTNPAGYAALNNAGYDAVKRVFPDAKVIVHIQNGQDKYLAPWLYGVLQKAGGKWDVCGFSLYPDRNDAAQYVEQALNVMQSCINKFDKDVMLCEVGMGNSYVNQCKDFLTECFNLTNRIPDGRFLGVMYWEPECYNGWNGYQKGAFTSKGRPSAALEAYSQSDSAVRPVYAE